ncbi:MAG TPA: hypothetical protein VJI15_04150 [Candidatus Nanoarchaeia archaeon]|nr:hypothetical protein [Candidatus Nanoarchaeia archaeon]
MATTGFNQLAFFLERYGFLDFLLPFILVFTIIFAVLRKTKIMGEKKSYDVIIALVLGLLFVVPHIIGIYPLGYDPVMVLNETLPSVALIAVAALMLLILMGMFGTDFAKGAAPLIALAAIAFIVYVFGAALNLWTGSFVFNSWFSPDTIELTVIIVVFALVVYFIVREPKSEGGKMLEWAKNLFDKRM